MLRAAEVGTAAAALFQQVLRGLVAALEVIQLHRIQFGTVHDAVEKHQRNAALLNFIEVAEIVRRAGYGYQNAVDLGVYHRHHVLLLLLVVLVRLAEQHVEAGPVGHRLGSLHHLREEMAVDVGHNHAQRVAMAFAQGGGQVVGLVVELLGQLLHPVAGGLADARMPAQA